MPSSSGIYRTVKHLFEGMTSHTFTTCCSSGDMDYHPECGERLIEFPLSLSVSTTHKFEFGLWIHYQTLSVTSHMSLTKFPYFET
jgi:hypothetical protein